MDRTTDADGIPRGVLRARTPHDLGVTPEIVRIGGVAVGGPACGVFALQELSQADLLRLDQVLEESSERMRRTRRGRVFDLWVGGRPFDVSVERTQDILELCQDQLLDFDLLPEDAPYHISLSAGVNDAHAYETLRRLCAAIGREFRTRATEPVK